MKRIEAGLSLAAARGYDIILQLLLERNPNLKRGTRTTKHLSSELLTVIIRNCYFTSKGRSQCERSREEWLDRAFSWQGRASIAPGISGLDHDCHAVALRS